MKPDRRKAPRPDSRDRRTDERQAVQMTLWIAGPHGEEHEPLSVNDVSLSGLAFRSDIAWAEGDAVKVYVNVDRPLELTARVSRCVERDGVAGAIAKLLRGPHYDVGIEFREPDAERREQVVDQIFLSEVYHRGLYV